MSVLNFDMEREILFKFNKIHSTSKKLTCSLIQAAQMLILLNAELARVLKVQCTDIGRLLEGLDVIEKNSEQWEIAHKFIYFYNLLYDKFNGDAVAMRHWLHINNKALKNTPFLKIIDNTGLDEVILQLESCC